MKLSWFQTKKTQTPGELSFPQTQHVKISTNFFKRILETDFYKVLYNLKSLFSVSNNESHTPAGSKPSQWEEWSEQPLQVPHRDGFTPKGWGWLLWQPCE